MNMHYVHISGLVAFGLLAGLEAYIISPTNDKSSATNGLPNEVDTGSTTRSKQAVNETKPANQSDSNSEDIIQAEVELYWLNRRDQFFNQTTFNLDKVSALG